MSHARLKSAIRRIPPLVSAVRAVRGAMRHRTFRRQFDEFRRLNGRSTCRLPVEWSDVLPCLNDRTATTNFDRHYVYHCSWAARVLAASAPAYHIDISSILYFCSIVSAFVPVRFYDYRPADLKLDNLVSEAADLTALPFPDRSVQSISCMHVVEHVGLGRYGDPLDPDGDVKAMSELQRVVAPGGSLLFVVPVGRPKVRFNAHRIYAYDQIVGGFPDLKIHQFALISEDPAKGGLILDAPQSLVDAEEYGCGCFWFKRPVE